MLFVARGYGDASFKVLTLFMRFLYPASLLLLLAACKPASEKNLDVPKNILGADKMIAVLTESYLAESASGLNVLNVPGTKFDSVYVFNPLKDNGVSKSQFDSSLAFYSKHPKALKAIYEKVLEKLSRIQAAGKVMN